MELLSGFASSTADYLPSSTPFSVEGFQNHVLWVLIVGYIIAFVLATGVGANDVANTFGTSVGSGVITLRNACIMATVFEMLGATLVGYKVSDTIRKGIVDVHVYKDDPDLYMQGNLAALGGSAIWLFLATFLKMPISGTHSIVGSVLGFSLVLKGTDGIVWSKVGQIVLSWFLSPFLSGMASAGIFWLIQRFILNKDDAITIGLRSLPIFYGLTVFINIISVALDGPEFMKITIEGHKWFKPFFGVSVSAVLGLVVAALVYVILLPRLSKAIRDDPEATTPRSTVMRDLGQRKKSLKARKGTNGYTFIDNNRFITSLEQNQTNVIPVDEMRRSSGAAEPLLKSGAGKNGTSVVHVSDDCEKAYDAAEQDEGDKPAMRKLFSALQILTAAFGSFAHGGNDVSNAIGPLIALWLVYDTGDVQTKAQTPFYLLIYGGVGISLGLWIWGRRVIKTMGEDLTKITPSSGFTIEIGAAITVLLASKIGLPVSTTHCKVGSVVTVGQIRTKGSVDWKLFRNIFLAWIVTVPVSGGLSAMLVLIIRAIA